MSTIPVIINAIITAAGLALDAAFIYTESKKKYLPAVILKGLAALCFVIIGIVNYNVLPTGTGKLIVIGLIFGMAGDIFLNMRYLFSGGASNKVFAVGILAFLTGHFLYIAALIKMKANLIVGIIAAVVLCAVCIPQIMKRVTAPSKGLKIFGYVYLAIVITMFSFAVGLAASGINAASLMFVLGALLFMVSDFVMILNSFGKNPTQTLRTTNLLTYYIGQLIIAFCILALK